jgi:DNA polymerase III delta subunit
MLYVLKGPDEFERRKRLLELVGDQWLRRSVEEGLGGMLAVIGQADLFGLAPAVVLTEVFSLKGDEQALLAQTLEAVKNMDQVVVIEVEQADWPKAKGPLLDLLQNVTNETFALVAPGQVVRWLSDQAAGMGIQIDKAVLPLLAAQLGYNKMAIASELERLRWRGMIVTEAVLEELLPMGAEVAVFGAMDSWAQQNIALTLSQLRQLWRQQTAAQVVLSLFERQARLLYTVKQFELASPEASKLGIQPFMLPKLKNWSKKWSVEQLRQTVLDLAELDKQSKSGGLGLEFGLESWVITSINNEIALQAAET